MALPKEAEDVKKGVAANVDFDTLKRIVSSITTKSTMQKLFYLYSKDRKLAEEWMARLQNNITDWQHFIKEDDPESAREIQEEVERNCYDIIALG